MINKIYAIYDNKAKAFMQPFTTQNAELAIRTFKEHVNNPESIFHRHPNDFCLYEVGTFDDQTGLVDNHIENHNLGLAAEFIQDNNPTQMELVK